MTFNLLLNIGYISLIIYTVAVAIFIISENRTLQATFAWLLVLIALPLVGLIIYIFLGRGAHAFSQETELARQEMGSDLMRDFGPLAGRQQAYIDRIAIEKPASLSAVFCFFPGRTQPRAFSLFLLFDTFIRLHYTPSQHCASDVAGLERP